VGASAILLRGTDRVKRTSRRAQMIGLPLRVAVPLFALCHRSGAPSCLAVLSLLGAPEETGQRHGWPREDGLSVIPVVGARPFILVVGKRRNTTQLVGMVADVAGWLLISPAAQLHLIVSPSPRNRKEAPLGAPAAEPCAQACAVASACGAPRCVRGSARPCAARVLTSHGVLLSLASRKPYARSRAASSARSRLRGSQAVGVAAPERIILNGALRQSPPFVPVAGRGHHARSPFRPARQARQVRRWRSRPSGSTVPRPPAATRPSASRDDCTRGLNQTETHQAYSPARSRWGRSPGQWEAGSGLAS
jgi:hypothetical protein